MSLRNLLLSSVLVFSSVAALATEVIPFQQAAQFYNQTKTVEGTVVGTFCNEKMCFLNFDKDYRKYLSAVIQSSDFAKFAQVTGPALKAELDKMYMGKKVQITGQLNEYKGKNDSTGRPQISLTDATKIKVVTQ